MNDAPLVSVVMTTFNEPPLFITQSIQSILNQTLPDFELLLIDDSTNADTVAAIDALAEADLRLTVIREPRRIGFVRALNLGLKRARGTYIARMDGDDIALPNRFEQQVNFMEKNPEIFVVGGEINIINAAGQVTGHRDYPTTAGKIKIFALFRAPLAHPTIMMRRKIIDDGFLYDESFLNAEDLELWLRIMRHGYRICNMPETLLLYRVNGNIADKRTKTHFRFSYLARIKNFSWYFPLWSLLSILISKLYTLIPKPIVEKIYMIENTHHC